MTTSSLDQIRVGQVAVPLEVAASWVREYTNAERNRTSVDPYAFPAYDEFDGGTTDPGRLTDADLLAPGLLNVPVKIRSFYALQRVRGVLETALSHDDLALPLADIEVDRIDVLVASLYGILDDPGRRPWNVKATTLSKILHRKRPQSIVLHDRWVRACYVGPGAPVPRVRSRSWVKYLSLVTSAVREDIRSQQPQMKELDASTCVPGQVSHVRLLDILAWKSRGGSPAEEAGERESPAPAP